MSAAEHRAAIDRAAAAFNDPARREEYFHLYDDGVVFHGFPGIPPGIESVRQFYAAFWAAFPDARFTAHDTLAEGDRVAMRFVVEGTHRGDFQGIAPTGRRAALDGIGVLRFAGGRCVERWTQMDVTGFMQQLGAAPDAVAAA
jgi:predicted ester cyclase